MFDEMKAQVKIIPLSLTRLAVSQSARQSLSICCHHSTLGTDCVSSSEIRACLSGDSWFIIEVSAAGGGGGGGVWVSCRLSLARAQRSYLCSPRSRGKRETGNSHLKDRIIHAIAFGKHQNILAIV